MSSTAPTAPRSHRDLEPVSDDEGPTQLRQAFGCAPSSVAVVAASTPDGEATGMLVSSLVPVSLDPPLLSICVQRGSRTWDRLDDDDADRLGISVLDDTCERLCAQLVRPATERFSSVDHVATDDGAVLLPDAGAWFVCSVHDRVDAGDHLIILLRVERLSARPETTPLVFHGSRYRRLVA
jgi:flavin reductase (DIM6/NTAB) family NADH-FMN oxidoreductase RutF